MNNRIKHALGWGLCGLLLTGAGCKQEEDVKASETSAPGSAAAPQAETPPVTNAAPGGDGLTEQVDAAVADVSARTGIAANAITVTQASIVNWSNGSVGCPEEGRAYTQAIVPGILILLEADGEIYRYHGRAGANVFHCPNDRARAPAFGPGKEFM